MGLSEDAYRYAVKNAFLHGGKADVAAVVGKIKALHPKLDVGGATRAAVEAVRAVNALGLKEIEREYKRFEESYELKPKEKSSFLPELEWASREPVVTRFAPNPNGPFHFGNARAAVLSHEFARAYNGRFLLRFDDTDPKVKRPIEDAERVFREDLEWLGCRVDETFFASDRLDIYYDFMRRALGGGFAYVCTCDVGVWRELVKAKRACPCRSLREKEQLERFEGMLRHEFRGGEAVLRIKTDLRHSDPSVRDWWAARIVDEPEHPRVKGKFVWPSYNFASAVDDHLLGVTLVVRGQEHEQNKTKQEFLYKYFGWRYPHCFHFGRVMLKGVVLSTSKIKGGIERGFYSGWDDPRLGTIRALRRRGFQAKALREAILEVGVKASDVSIDLKRLADLNKAVLGETKRIVFFREPLRLDVDFAPETRVEIDGKSFFLSSGIQRFLVDGFAIEGFRVGDTFRLRNVYNVKLTRIDPLQVSARFVGTTKTKMPVVSWLLTGIDAEVVMPDNSRVLGLVGEEICRVSVGSVVYLDRFGFCRIDSLQEKRAVLWFAHS